MDIFKLVASLSLDSSKYEQGLEDAEKKGGGFGEKLKTAAKGIGVVMMAATTATAAVGGAFIAESGKVAEFGDNIDKASQKLGISAKAYQEWDAVLQHSGSSIESMGFGMKTLMTQASKNSEAFTQLGLSQEKVASMSREDLFSETITALQNVTDENERARLAQKLFGRSAMELGPLLNTSAEETQAMKDRVNELGGVMSDDAVKAAAKYQDSLQDMMTAVGGISRGLVSNFLPAVTTVMDGIGNLLSGNSGEGLGQIKEGVSNFIQTFMDAIPKVMEIGGTIISAVGQAIIENLPVMLEAGLQAILELSNGISSSLPELIPTIVDVIMQMVITLVDNADLLVEAALNLIIALAEGLISALPALIDKVPILISKLVAALVASAPRLLAAALELFNALVVGFIQITSHLLADIYAFIGEIITPIISAVQTAWETIKTVVNVAIQVIGVILSNAVTILTLPWQFLWKNFGGIITEKWKAFKSIISTALDVIGKTISSVWNAISSTLSGVLDTIESVITSKWNAAKETVSDALDSIKGTVSEIWNSIYETISDIIGNIVSGVKEKFDGISEIVSKIFESVKSAITGPIETAKEFIGNAIDTIRGLFENAGFEFPHINLPHFSWDWVDIGGVVSVPSISIDWYKKAYEQPYMFTTPTVIGNKGFGDGPGGEMVYGHENLMADIKEAVKSGGGGTFAPVINIYTREGQSNKEIAEYVINEIDRRYNREGKEYA